MKTVFIFLWTTLVPWVSFSQDYLDLVKVDYSVGTKANFVNSDASTRVEEYNVDLTLPIPINDKLTLLTGTIYENTRASFLPNTAPFSVTGITLKAGANIQHTEKLSATYMLLPKLASDFNRLGSRDFQLGGAVLFKYKKSRQFNYRFGVYANDELFSKFIVPIFGIYYQNISKKLEVKVMLPLSADVNYKIYKNTALGLNFRGQMRSYNLTTPIFPQENSYLVRSANDAFVYLQHHISNGIHFRAGIGRSIGRSYRVYDESVSFALPLVSFNDKRKQLNTDFEDSWIFKFSAFYRLDLSKK